ncbi:hypothetical protein E3N88_29131 [Mikania micrantha]|uniref:Uncharacterized protein n=1 Tax=Mikania micrantha TaxID=192012 RepID=A0A5N6LDG3_9ASTR|nr:hypothetical protein E3N88_44012 [Mikania micrantha]KAD4180540.1 hypothetical protein E3N88_29131 [Mikania micrantha]
MSTVDRYSLKYKRKRIGVSTDTDCKVEENVTKKSNVSIRNRDISKWFIKKRKDKSCDTKENNQKDQGVVHEAENTMDVGHAKAGENVLEIVPYMGEEATNVEENIDANEDHELQHEASEMDSEETISEGLTSEKENEHQDKRNAIQYKEVEKITTNEPQDEGLSVKNKEIISEGVTSEKENEHQGEGVSVKNTEISKDVDSEEKTEECSMFDKVSCLFKDFEDTYSNLTNLMRECVSKYPQHEFVKEKTRHWDEIAKRIAGTKLDIPAMSQPQFDDHIEQVTPEQLNTQSDPAPVTFLQATQPKFDETPNLFNKSDETQQTFKTQEKPVYDQTPSNVNDQLQDQTNEYTCSFMAEVDKIELEPS